ncbi:MAG: TIM barrel protein [Candidatus Micrarchaeia archaeon]
MRWGPAGIPLDFKGSTPEAIRYVAEEGLNAFECEFVKGVKMKKEMAEEARKVAKEKGVSLSAHAPYWINCAARERRKIEATLRNIIETARVARVMNASIIVFHPGFYMGRTAEETKELVKKTLEEALERMKQEGIKGVWLGLETTGKGTQFGSLSENIELSSALEMTKPVIDFAHIHAREGGSLKKKEDYLKIFDEVERKLGKDAVKNFHSHFSEVAFNEKGEKHHLILGEQYSPPFKPLAEVIFENGYDGTIISESPLLDVDALKMKRIYEGVASKK